MSSVKYNMDYNAAKFGQEIAMDIPEADKKDIERCVTKTLGVLQANGIYASLLYMCSRTDEKEEKISRYMMKKLLEIGESMLNIYFENKTDPKVILSDIANKVLNDIDSVLLLEELWKQTLIYARYNAKAR